MPLRKPPVWGSREECQPEAKQHTAVDRISNLNKKSKSKKKSLSFYAVAKFGVFSHLYLAVRQPFPMGKCLKNGSLQTNQNS